MSDLCNDNVSRKKYFEEVEDEDDNIKYFNSDSLSCRNFLREDDDQNNRSDLEITDFYSE